MSPLLLLIIYCLPSSILVVLPGAYVPLGLSDLVVLCAGMLEVPQVLLMRILARQDDLRYVIIKSKAVSLICISAHVIS
jgi:hypothetical protein